MSTPRRVLLIDDEIFLLRTISRLMKIWGYDVDILESGLETIQWIEKSVSEENMYDIVFVDINMPEINGLAVLKDIKEQFPNLLCVVMTGFTDKKLKFSAFEAGCDNYMQKPFAPNELRVVIEDTIEKSGN